MAPTLYDEKPEPGDLIEIFRGSYQHWAVYIGDGFVVHLAPPSEVPDAGANSVMSVLTEKALVQKDGLWDVVGTDEWKISNSLDKTYEPRSPGVIVREACRLVGQVLPYCVIRGNCEHFVNELRYGKAESRQVRKVGEVAMYAGLAAAVAAAVAAVFFALARWLRGSKNENKETQ